MDTRQMIEFIDQNPDCVVDDPKDGRYCPCANCVSAREWVKSHEDLWLIYQTWGKYKVLKAL
ncbi:MAG: hypothetical protein NTU41_10825 [Chloroflexi bacterium]|nr:hypothetical protein [Chloroflexota bacterium]